MGVLLRKDCENYINTLTKEKVKTPTVSEKISDVLLTHSRIDCCLVDIISYLILGSEKDEDRLGDLIRRLSFSQKISFINDVIGLNESFKKDMCDMENIRNNLAHKDIFPRLFFESIEYSIDDVISKNKNDKTTDINRIFLKYNEKSEKWNMLFGLSVAEQIETISKEKKND